MSAVGARGRWLFGAASLAVLGGLTLGVRASGGPAGAAVLATWSGGTLLRADHESWRAAHNVDEGPEAIQEQVFVESLAAATRERGVGSDRRLQFMLQAARQRVLTRALKSRVLATHPVTDAEVEQTVREQPAAFQQPRKLRLRTIYLRSDPSPAARQAARERMAGIRRRLLEGTPFEEIARDESESQSRFRDGDLGYLAPEDLPPPVAEAVRELLPGELSDAVEHGEGISIFRCEEIRAPKEPGPEELRRKVRAVLERHRARTTWASFEQELLDSASAQLDAESPTAPLVMDGYQLSAEDFEALIALHRSGDQGTDLDAGGRDGVLRYWAIDVLAARRAEALGLDEDPAVSAALRWRVLDVLAKAELVRRVDERLGEPDEASLRALYDAHPQRYAGPEMLDVALIHFGADDGPDRREVVRRAQEVARQLDHGEIGFDAAARLYSQHHSASVGGRIGWRTRTQVGQWGPIQARVVRQLEPGERSGVVRTDSGLWMFELRARRPAPPPSFDTAREKLLADWKKLRIRELEVVVREEQLARVDLEIR